MMTALQLADWLDGEAGAGGTNWNAKISGAAAELRRQAAEIERLTATEEGAKEAFGVVVQDKRDALAECKRLRQLLADCHSQIRKQAALLRERA